jgi:alpha-1,3-rhamnosyl/mannosyltransferase
MSSANANQTRSVHFLSQNRPGPRMGMGHYERLLIESLMKATSRDEWAFNITFDGRAPQGGIDASTLEPGLHCNGCLGFSTARLADKPLLMTRTAVALGVRGPQPDLYHSLALSFPPPNSRPAVFTIHDLPPARFDDEGSVPRWAKSVAQDAAAILTPSEFAKRELMELLELQEARVHVVPYGLEHDRFHPNVAPASAEVLSGLGLPGKYLLYVGGATRRKNVRALLQAWQEVQGGYPDLHLALAGPQQPLQALADEAKAPRVIVPGYLSRDVLPNVMKSAVAVVFPSIYEGFGMPPQEAMALGVPAVVSRAGGAVPEVVGEAAVLAEDGSADAIAHAIKQLLDDSGLQERLRQQGPQRAQAFSWPQHAQTVLGIYRDALK